MPLASVVDERLIELRSSPARNRGCARVRHHLLLLEIVLPGLAIEAFGIVEARCMHVHSAQRRPLPDDVGFRVERAFRIVAPHVTGNYVLEPIMAADRTIVV